MGWPWSTEKIHQVVLAALKAPASPEIPEDNASTVAWCPFCGSWANYSQDSHSIGCRFREPDDSRTEARCQKKEKELNHYFPNWKSVLDWYVETDALWAKRAIENTPKPDITIPDFGGPA